MQVCFSYKLVGLLTTLPKNTGTKKEWGQNIIENQLRPMIQVQCDDLEIGSMMHVCLTCGQLSKTGRKTIGMGHHQTGCSLDCDRQHGKENEQFCHTYTENIDASNVILIKL
ncbi:hypothetical protein ILYODFUR_033595 [Ilyodon furcidens]|uniref:Uncharacterized protein n=1 Tax=Ilyodon furcidens TaxID=33524 RepID=A0ABV0V8A7_9TELE